MVCIEITLLDLCAYTIYHRLVFLFIYSYTYNENLKK